MQYVENGDDNDYFNDEKININENDSSDKNDGYRDDDNVMQNANVDIDLKKRDDNDVKGGNDHQEKNEICHSSDDIEIHNIDNIVEKITNRDDKKERTLQETIKDKYTLLTSNKMEQLDLLFSPALQDDQRTETSRSTIRSSFNSGEYVLGYKKTQASNMGPMEKAWSNDDQAMFSKVTSGDRKKGEK